MMTTTVASVNLDIDNPRCHDVCMQPDERNSMTASQEAILYYELCDDARALGIPVSLDDPASPTTVAGLQDAVDAARLGWIMKGTAYITEVEDDLEERGLIVTNHKPYATVTSKGKALIARVSS